MAIAPSVGLYKKDYFGDFDWYKFQLMQNYLPKEKVKFLDVGSGSGFFLRILKKHGYDYDYTGLDFSEEQIELAKKEGTTVLKADLNDTLPLDDNSFDIILASEIIEHIYDTDKFLEELHRLLKPGGKLILTTPNIASLGERIRLLRGIRPAAIDVSVRNTPAHIHGFTLADLKDLFKSAGLKLEYATGWDFYLPFGSTKDSPVMGKVCLTFAKTLPTFSAGFFCVCEK